MGVEVMLGLGEGFCLPLSSSCDVTCAQRGTTCTTCTGLTFNSGTLMIPPRNRDGIKPF